jgi:hypothetical protein
MDSFPSDFSTTTKRPEITRRGVILLFAIGSLMLVVPLGTILTENSMCKSSPAACIDSQSYRYLVSAFPYIMIAGGLLIAYNMKRISDSINYEDDEEAERDDRSDSMV